MVLAELARRVPHGLEHGGSRRRFVGHAERGAGLADGGQPGADGQLASDEVRAPRRAARLSVIVSESHAFGRHLVQIGRPNGHHALIVNADVGPADVVAHDEDDVGPLLLLCGRRRARRCHGNERREQTEADVPGHTHVSLQFWLPEMGRQPAPVPPTRANCRLSNWRWSVSG
jgi:hypothetical protein